MAWQRAMKTFGYALPMLLHSVGFILLCRVKCEVPNQRAIAMNLAASETLYCMSGFIYNVLRFVFPREGPEILYYVIVFLDISTFVNSRLVFVNIIVDCFLYIWLNIKYTMYVNTKRVRIAIITQGFLSVVSGLTFVKLLKYQIIQDFLTFSYFNISLDAVVVASAIIVYTYIFIKVNKITKEMRKQSNSVNHDRKDKNVSHRVWSKLTVPTLMVVTFILFNVNSAIMNIVIKKQPSKNPSLPTASLVLELLGHCLEAFINVLLIKSIRDILFGVIGRRISEGRVSQVSMIVSTNADTISSTKVVQVQVNP